MSLGRHKSVFTYIMDGVQDTAACFKKGHFICSAGIFRRVLALKSSKKELLDTLQKIRGLPVLVAGDLMLDRYIWGKVERISPEAPVPVVHTTRIEDRLGGAGNVARNLASLGAKVALSGFVGDDKEGQAILEIMDRDGIQKEGVIVDRSRPTCLKTRVIAHSQQVVRIDREELSHPAAALCEGFAAVVDAQIDASRAVILSDYGKGCVSQPIMKKLVEARRQGRLGSGARPFLVDPHPANYELYRGISIAKPNRREAEKASGVRIVDRQSALKAARTLLELWDAEMMLVTLGEDGLALVNGPRDEGLFLETVAIEVHDVSGAGDTVTAIFGAALACGASPAVAGDLANIGAGVVVSEVGTVAIDPEKLCKEIDRLAR